ncbi:MAG: hypothetical protein AAF702_08265 [Chloroflexota bacterium]
MDGILGIGPLEIIIVVALALIFLGPERLPGTIREIAKFIRQTRAIGSELTSQFSQELNMLDEFNPKKILEDVVGEDEKVNAKELLGIDEEDIKADLGELKRKTTKAASSSGTSKVKSAKTPTPSSTSSKSKSSTNAATKNLPKPALGEVDTTAADDTEPTDVDSSEEETRTSEANSTGNKETNPTQAQDSTVSELKQNDSQDDSLDSETMSENRIAPPNGATAQPLVKEKVGSTHGTDRPSSESLPEGVDTGVDTAEAKE